MSMVTKVPVRPTPAEQWTTQGWSTLSENSRTALSILATLLVLEGTPLGEGRKG